MVPGGMNILLLDKDKKFNIPVVWPERYDKDAATEGELTDDDINFALMIEREVALMCH
jgi:hypothetical protein